MERKKLNKILFAIIGISVLLLMTISIINSREGNECIKNPFIYGSNKAITEDTGEIFCYCSVENPSYSSFYFNSREISTNPVVHSP